MDNNFCGAQAHAHFITTGRKNTSIFNTTSARTIPKHSHLPWESWFANKSTGQIRISGHSLCEIRLKQYILGGLFSVQKIREIYSKSFRNLSGPRKDFMKDFMKSFRNLSEIFPCPSIVRGPKTATVHGPNFFPSVRRSTVRGPSIFWLVRRSGPWSVVRPCNTIGDVVFVCGLLLLIG